MDRQGILAQSGCPPRQQHCLLSVLRQRCLRELARGCEREPGITVLSALLLAQLPIHLTESPLPDTAHIPVEKLQMVIKIKRCHQPHHFYARSGSNFPTSL